LELLVAAHNTLYAIPERQTALWMSAIQKMQMSKFQGKFSERKSFIEKTITDQGKMTDDLQSRLNAAISLVELEDIYLPFKPKRKTRAQTARENGLEPLALKLLEQLSGDVREWAITFLNEKIKDVDEALHGARDIIAEMVNEDAEMRNTIRRLFEDSALVKSQAVSEKEQEGLKYKDYFDFSEPVAKIPSHRILALCGPYGRFLRRS